jgi:hypothetical protein
MARIMKEFTPAEREAWQRSVAEAESPAERAESEAYFRLAKAAAAEPTFSGELRRAIHSIHQRRMFLDTLLERAQVDWATLRPFMIGEAPLPSDVIDRLVNVLGLHLQTVDAVGVGSCSSDDSISATP